MVQRTDSPRLHRIGHVLGEGERRILLHFNDIRSESTTVYSVPKKRTAVLSMRMQKRAYGQIGFTLTADLRMDFPKRASMVRALEEKPSTLH